MPDRFCASCGAAVLSGANFCVECGERLPTAKVQRGRLAFPLQRYAPLLIGLAVIVVGGSAVVVGVLSPKTAPSVPGRNTASVSAEGGADGQANLPQGHPPITIPDQVKQAIRDLAKKADAAPDDLATWKQLAEVQYRAGQLEGSYLPDAA